MNEEDRSKDEPANNPEHSEAISPDLVESVPEEVLQTLDRHGIKGKEADKLITSVIFSRRTHAGPLPPAEQFRTYEEVSPGAATRILKYMENEQSHRHTMDETLSKAYIKETTLGQIFAFLIIIICIVSSIYETNTGHPIMASILLGAPILGAISKFIDGRKDNAAEHEDGEEKDKKN
jgi:uncharacterized membrane protein